MKKSELQTIIREEIKNAMVEAAAPSRAFKNWKVKPRDRTKSRVLSLLRFLPVVRFLV